MYLPSGNGWSVDDDSQDFGPYELTFNSARTQTRQITLIPPENLGRANYMIPILIRSYANNTVIDTVITLPYNHESYPDPNSMSYLEWFALMSGIISRPHEFPLIERVLFVIPTPQNQIGNMIANNAFALIGHPSEEFLPSLPRLACSAFVSKVLMNVNVLSEQELAARVLPGKIAGKGAVQVIAKTPLNSNIDTSNMKKGDIIFFWRGADGTDDANEIHHTGIYYGDGFMIDNSSNAHLIAYRTIASAFGDSVYKYYEVWRFQ